MRFPLFLALGLVVATALLHAQSDDEDAMDYFPLVPSGNSFQFGLRYVGGPKVSFGQLGLLPTNVVPGDATGVESRTYNDGAVGLDTRTDANGNPTNDGLTNTWVYQYDSQVTANGDMAFHAYSTGTLGNGFDSKRATAEGWELQVAHSLFKIGGRIDVSLVGGFSFTSLSSKISGDVPAELTTITDVYPLYGQTPPGAGSPQPTTTIQYVYDANGNPVLTSGGSPQTRTVDTSTLLGNEPTRTVTTSQTDVKGRWEVKGAYYTLRIGPQIQMPITERLKFSIGAGAAVAYVGTRYIVDESVNLTDVSTPLQSTTENTHSMWLPAYYADADAQYWLTERTGFFMGASYQKSKSFNETLGGRTAQIDLSTTYGVRSGFTLRF